MSINVDNTGSNNITLTTNGSSLLVNGTSLVLGAVTIQVVPVLPGSPDPNTLYIVTG